MQTSGQAHVWKKIADTYQQWDQDRFELMALDDLSERLPEFEPELIEQALDEARDAGRVATSGDGRFRLVPNN